MILAKKIKLKLNKDCKNYLEFASNQCRLLYNFSLSDKISFYKEHNKTLSIYDQKKQLPTLKKKFPDYSKVYNKCLSATLFRLDSAFKHFFRRIKNKETPGFPKFKSKNEFVSQEYPGMYIKILDSNMFTLPTGKGVENFIIRTSEPIPEKYRTVTIIKQKNSYYATFLYEKIPKKINYEKKQNLLAIDLGIKTLVTGYNTEKEFIEIRKFSHYTKHLDELRSKRDTKTKKSRKWFKYNKIFQKHIKKYVDRVTDYLHKVSKKLVKRKETAIVVGKLNLDGMIKPKQAWFNKILQNEWRVKKFVGFLKYKCEKYGKIFFEVDERYTTKNCSMCGNRKQKILLSERIYSCESCGFVLGRDMNSAINIYKKAMPTLLDLCKNRNNEFNILETKVEEMLSNLEM